MTLKQIPWALTDGGAAANPAERVRQAHQAHITGSGVMNAGDLAVSALGSPNMSVNVAAGSIWIPGTLGSTSGEGTNVNAQTAYGSPAFPATFTSQGCYFDYNDATVNLTITAANATNPRTDLIVATVQDADYAGVANQAILQVITGTAGGGAPVPYTSVPANSVVLAQINVGAGVTSITSGNITDVRPFSQPIGTASTYVVGAIRFQWGSVTISGSSSATHSQAITFPVPFSATPSLVQVTGNGNGTYPTYLNFEANGASNTGFTITSNWADGSTHAGGGSAWWFAIGAV